MLPSAFPVHSLLIAQALHEPFAAPPLLSQMGRAVEMVHSLSEAQAAHAPPALQTGWVG